MVIEKKVAQKTCPVENILPRDIEVVDLALRVSRLNRHGPTLALILHY